MNGLEGEQKDFVVDTELNREPMELLEDRSDVMEGGGSSNDTGS